MKKLLFLLLLICKSAVFSQTILASFPLDLKKGDEQNQILNVENTLTHDVFIFAATTENMTILKYNSAVFLNGQFTFPKTNLENRSVVGYSFGEDGNPSLYWASENFKDFIIVKYYLETKTFKMLKFNFPFTENYIVNFFQKNNAFYILSKSHEDQTLVLYIFKNGTVEEKSFDFGSFQFENDKKQFFTFNKIIREDPIEKIDTNEFAPLDKSAKKNKAYLINDHLILTLDYNPKKTQVFDLDVENHTIIEKNFTQSLNEYSNKTSNSFFADDKLYQINANKYALSFEIKDYNSGKSIKDFKVTKNDTIKFKNSPLLLQTGDRKPTELKKTSQFLNQLAFLDIGISAFKNRHNTVITIGGTPKEENFYQYYEGGFAPINSQLSVYFESTMNNNLEFIKEQQQPLAIDNIYYFMSLQKKTDYQNIFKFKDYYILGYYDNGTKQYVMRKFTDGFIQPDITNPIINKAIFSRSFPVEKP